MFKKADLEIYEIDLEDIIMTSPGEATGGEVGFGDDDFEDEEP